MDSLTQMVLGASVGEVVLGKKFGNKAMLWGAVAGTIPDLDVLSKYFTDEVTALEMHRGFSHSILFCVLASPVFGWLINKIYKGGVDGWKDWSLLMFWGLFTHPLLDAHTTWGTQLFWPFDLRIAYKNIFVVDPLYTLPFLIFLIWAMIKPLNSSIRRKLNYMGLVISSIYMIITIGFKFIAYQKFTAELEKQNIDYTDIEIRPTPLNTILWAANIETTDCFLTGYYSLFDDDELSINFQKISKNHKLLEDLNHEEKVKKLIKISKGWYSVAKKDGQTVFNDLRFGQMNLESKESNFVFSFELRYNEEGVLMVKELPKTFKDGRKILKTLLNRILGADI